MRNLWRNQNYWRLTGWVLLIGLIIILIGFALNGFKLDAFRYQGNLETRPWYRIISGMVDNDWNYYMGPK